MRRWFAAAAVAAICAAAGCGDAEADPAPPDCARVSCVALTFDDGPDDQTVPLLDLLAARGVRATFFVIGEQVREHPAVLRRIAVEGHEIGNHTWDHGWLTRLSASEVQEDLRRTAQAIAEVTGTTPTLVRPPFGAVDEEAAAAIDAPIILWSVDPRDWRARDSGTIGQRVLAEVRPGSIVLLHDVYRTTVEAMPGIIDTLKGRGYTFVTVSQLFGEPLDPGMTYQQRVPAPTTDPAIAHRRFIACEPDFGCATMRG